MTVDVGRGCGFDVPLCFYPAVTVQQILRYYLWWWFFTIGNRKAYVFFLCELDFEIISKIKIEIDSGKKAQTDTGQALNNRMNERFQNLYKRQ